MQIDLDHGVHKELENRTVCAFGSNTTIHPVSPPHSFSDGSKSAASFLRMNVDRYRSFNPYSLFVSDGPYNPKATEVP